MWRKLDPALIVFATILALTASDPAAAARDWYVSAARGKGRDGTMEKPAKDLGNIISKLEEGDRIFIAEGVYTGRGDSGQDVITVPVEIYGGWNADFTLRDPWGAHHTILSGQNDARNFAGEYRLVIDLRKWKQYRDHRIVVDGLIIDNGERNRYATDEELKIVRMARMPENATPGSGGLMIAPFENGEVIVRNCIVINTAPADGVYSFSGAKGSHVTVENNLAANNTGNGFSLQSGWRGDEEDQWPRYTFQNNTSIFNEKYDFLASHGGCALRLEADTRVVATGNVLACNDYYAVHNARQSRDVVLTDNLIWGNLADDYLEFDTEISLDDLEDESELLDDAEGNVKEAFPAPVSEEWMAAYLSRSVIDREIIEQGVGPKEDHYNELRSMLGQNLQGADLNVDSEVWLPRLSLDDALKLAEAPILGKYGCRKPAPSSSVD